MKIKMCHHRLALAVAFVACLSVVRATTRGNAAEPPSVKTTTVLNGLDNPAAVVNRPGTNELFISESGAGQVVRMLTDRPGVVAPVVTGFSVAAAPGGLGFQVGPLGIAFLDRVTFAVGGGGAGEGHDVLKIYPLPPSDKSLKADDVRQTLGPIGAGADSQAAEGFFYGVATMPNAIFVTSRGDNTAGWVSRAFVLDNNGKAADLKPLINGLSENLSREGGQSPFVPKTPQKGTVPAGGPTALTISKRGELVVGESGPFDKPHDSSIAFYNPKNGKLLLTMRTGLSDIMGLAYCPHSGNLYAIDLAWSDPKEGGLYRLDATRLDGKMGVKAIKIAPLDKPSSLSFASDGALYITLLGTAKEGAKQKPGQLVKITGDL
ncbi:MAG TPA: hypothetical protein VG056_01475 [Pirellulales bacterium]|nr:hypothetical protein [Pirellulales bacterium]